MECYNTLASIVIIKIMSFLNHVMFSQLKVEIAWQHSTTRDIQSTYGSRCTDPPLTNHRSQKPGFRRQWSCCTTLTSLKLFNANCLICLSAYWLNFSLLFQTRYASWWPQLAKWKQLNICVISVIICSWLFFFFFCIC